MTRMRPRPCRGCSVEFTPTYKMGSPNPRSTNPMCDTCEEERWKKYRQADIANKYLEAIKMYIAEGRYEEAMHDIDSLKLTLTETV